MSVIPKDLSSKFASPFIKAEEFKNPNGLKLICKGFEIVNASDPKYGAEEKSALVTKGICQPGQTLRYKFQTIEEMPIDKNFDSTSITFFIAFSEAAPNDGETVLISREGEGKNTKYTVSVIK